MVYFFILSIGLTLLLMNLLVAIFTDAYGTIKEQEIARRY
jgi:hypothetical protein